MKARTVFGVVFLLVSLGVTSAQATPKQDFGHALGIDIDLEEFWSVKIPARLVTMNLSAKRGDRVRVLPMVRITDTSSGQAVMIDIDVEEFWSADRTAIGKTFGVRADAGAYWKVTTPAKLRSHHLGVKQGARVRIEPFLLLINIRTGQAVMKQTDLSGRWHQKPRKK